MKDKWYRDIHNMWVIIVIKHGKQKWKMAFNLDKCNVLFITRNKTPINMHTPYMDTNFNMLIKPNIWVSQYSRTLNGTTI